MVAAIGDDRPGVVAALAGVLVELGCNLSDAQMAVLQGHASMMLVVDCPPSVGPEALHASLTERTKDLGHEVWVRPLCPAGGPVDPEDMWQVSVHGANHPGVVFEVTRLLADAGINVVDLQSRQAGSAASLTMRVDVPVGIDGEEVSHRLDRLGEQLGLACSMRPVQEGQ
jgi:glycine cleavage system transcriptional repressor